MSGGGEAVLMLVAHEGVHVDSWSRPVHPAGDTVADDPASVN
jgi:hypothetical protein